VAFSVSWAFLKRPPRGRGEALPLFPTQEGGEGWGEEVFIIFPSLQLSPTRASRGERVTRASQINGNGKMRSVFTRHAIYSRQANL
jgi:hypothetical protein